MIIAILVLSILNFVLLIAGGVCIVVSGIKAKRAQTQLASLLAAAKAKQTATTLVPRDGTGG